MFKSIAIFLLTGLALYGCAQEQISKRSACTVHSAPSSAVAYEGASTRFHAPCSPRMPRQRGSISTHDAASSFTTSFRGAWRDWSSAQGESTASARHDSCTKSDSSQPTLPKAWCSLRSPPARRSPVAPEHSTKAWQRLSPNRGSRPSSCRGGEAPGHRRHRQQSRFRRRLLRQPVMLRSKKLAG